MLELQEDPKTLAEYIHQFPRKDTIREIACPKCSEYVDLWDWDCPCSHHNEGRSFITKGCDVCGTKFGEGDMDIHARECPSCKYEVDFFEPYKILNWSILHTGENSEEEFLRRFRWTDWTVASLVILGLWIVSFMVLVILEKGFAKDALSYPRVGTFIAGIFVLLAILGTQFHHKKLTRNPKYRMRDDEIT